MFNTKRFEMLSKSLEAVNKENDNLKNKNKALESMIQRQSRTIERLQVQLDQVDTEDALRVRNRELGKENNILKLKADQYKRKLKLVNEKVRHAFEMSRDDIAG